MRDAYESCAVKDLFTSRFVLDKKKNKKTKAF